MAVLASLAEEVGMARLMDLQPVKAVKPKVRPRVRLAVVMRFMFCSL
jgi:hypothetical protein